jgi:glycogen(starch) synthase
VPCAGPREKRAGGNGVAVSHTENNTTRDNSESSPERPSRDRLREICWDIGTRFPVSFTSDRIVFALVHPQLGYLHWHVQEASVERLRLQQGDPFHGAKLVVRVYDITDVEFDGFNAHSFFDIDAGGLSGTHYLPVHQMERNLLAEVGFRLPDNSFHALARSNTRFFDRDRPSGRFQLGGLYVGQDFRPLFPVESVIDAPVYERLNVALSEFERRAPLALACVHTGLDHVAEFGGRLRPVIDELVEKCARFQIRIERFGAPESFEGTGRPLTGVVEAHGDATSEALATRHQERPFDLVHCHDWHSVPAGVKASETLGLPLVLSLHSTEFERSRGPEMKEEAVTIQAWEKQGTDAAALVIVPHSSTRQQVLSLYDAAPEKVVIIPDVLEEQQTKLPGPVEEKQNLGLGPDTPVVLFSGEISHAAGADLLLEALITVCHENHQVHFLFAGEGPLKGELENRAQHAGLAHRCWFLGDVSAYRFERLLVACDFVVIPARTWQDEGLAQMATSYGKPVLITHQSHIRCIQHGQNGFITYDNPGSIVWGVKELLANPLHGNLLRVFAKRKAEHTQSLDSVAAEHYIAYQQVLASARETAHG